MKTLKIVLTVLLTAVIVVVGFATEILAAADITVLNPWFYETALDEMGFYENIRILLVNQINYYVDQQEAIPDEMKKDAYKVTENVFTKEKFSKQVGEFLGGTAEYIIHGKGDAVIPLNGWIADLNAEFEASGLVKDIMDYDVENGKLAEIDRELNYAEYKRVIGSTYTGYISQYSSFIYNSDKLSDFIKIFAPTKELQKSIEGRFWIIRYWVNRANTAAYVGLALVIIMAVLLFIVWRKKVGVALKIIGIILIVNSALFILLGIGLLLGLTVAGLLNAVPPFILAYIGIVQSLINPIALVALGTGMVMLVIGIILAVVGGALIRKKAESETKAEVSENAPSEVSEINYNTESDVVTISEEAPEVETKENDKSPEPEKESEDKPAEENGEDK